MGSASSSTGTKSVDHVMNSTLPAATQPFGTNDVKSNLSLPGATNSGLPPQLDYHGSESVVVKDPSFQQASGTNYSFEPTESNSTNDLSIQSATVESVTNYNNDNTNSTSIPHSEGIPNSYSDLSFTFFGMTVYLPNWLTLAYQTIVPWVGRMSDVAMVVCCVLPYVPQYITIHKRRNSSGFSTFVCLTLLLANILRVAFWFGKHFEITLLIQGFVMILTQLLLLELCVRVGTKSRERGLFELKYFWRWTNFSSYIEFLCLFSALLGIAMYFLIDCKPFVEMIGYISTLIEAGLGLPQAIKNYRNKSVVGMSLIMVLLWLGGDLFKTVYYITRSTPYQFWLCGAIQITVDLLILFQVCIFRQNAPIKNMGPRVDDSPKEMMTL